MNKIILASQSPRRKELLGKTGFPFEVVVSDCDENTDEKRPDKLVMELASLKAHDVYLKRNGNIVLGADTVVAHKGEILGKPKDKEEAFSMIKSFAGDTHQVYTGVCIIIPKELKNDDTAYDVDETVRDFSMTDEANGNVCISYNVKTDVIVSDITDDEITRYVETGEPMDKAGAYAIQGLFAPFISSINGDYYNVVGLPICSIYKLLKNGIKPVSF